MQMRCHFTFFTFHSHTHNDRIIISSSIDHSRSRTNHSTESILTDTHNAIDKLDFSYTSLCFSLFHTIIITTNRCFPNSITNPAPSIRPPVRTAANNVNASTATARGQKRESREKDDHPNKRLFNTQLS